MSSSISAEDAAAYVERWRRVEEAERREIREASMELKVRQLEALCGAIDDLGWRGG